MQAWVAAAIFCLFVVVSVECVRPIDGYGNNVANPTWGSAMSSMIKSVSWTDSSTLSFPHARNISNHVFGVQSQNDVVESMPPISAASVLAAYFGQLVALDIVQFRTNSTRVVEYPIDLCDQPFDIHCAGNVKFKWFDSLEDSNGDPINGVSAYLDAGFLYGVSSNQSALVRSYFGGKLRSQNITITNVNGGNIGLGADSSCSTPIFEELLPLDADLQGGMETDYDPSLVFLGGDSRINLTPPLVALITVFLREHNQEAQRLALEHPTHTDEELFQAARRYTIALYQQITLEEWLPFLTGRSLPTYTGYNSSIDASIDKFFASVAMKYGHSVVSDVLERWNSGKVSCPFNRGHQLLSDGISDPSLINFKGADTYIRGLLTQSAMVTSPRLTNALRNHINGPDDSFDLVVHDLLRSRSTGIASYTDMRQAYSLTVPTSFSDITSDTFIANRLADMYTSVSDVEAYVGALAEDSSFTKTKWASQVGDLIAESLMEQFARIRDGDSHYFEHANDLTSAQTSRLSSNTFRAVLKSNTALTEEELPKWSAIFSVYDVNLEVEVTEDENYEIYYVHAIAMGFSWGFCYPIGVFIARYLKHKTWWLTLHQSFMTFGATGTVFLALMTIVSSSGSRSTHGIVGIILSVFLIVQLALGYLVEYFLLVSSTENRQASSLSRSIHVANGWTLVSVGFWQLIMGIDAMFKDSDTHEDWRIFFWIWVSLVLCAYIGGDIYLYLMAAERKKFGTVSVLLNDQETVEKVAHLPQFNWAQVERRVSTGSSWVVIGGLIIDIRSFIPSHPGGQLVLRDLVGTDATMQFAGIRPNGEKGHDHSNRARQLLLEFAVGRVDVSKRFDSDEDDDFEGFLPLAREVSNTDDGTESKTPEITDDSDSKDNEFLHRQFSFPRSDTSQAHRDSGNSSTVRNWSSGALFDQFQLISKQILVSGRPEEGVKQVIRLRFSLPKVNMYNVHNVDHDNDDNSDNDSDSDQGVQQRKTTKSTSVVPVSSNTTDKTDETFSPACDTGKVHFGNRSKTLSNLLQRTKEALLHSEAEELSSSITFGYSPGSYILLYLLEQDMTPHQRQYTLTARDYVSSEYLEITLAVHSKGYCSQHLNQMMLGDLVRMSGPLPDPGVKCPVNDDGTFSYLGFIAGGIGITPFLSIIEFYHQMCTKPNKSSDSEATCIIRLGHKARSEDSFVGKERCQEIEKKFEEHQARIENGETKIGKGADFASLYWHSHVCSPLDEQDDGNTQVPLTNVAVESFKSAEQASKKGYKLDVKDPDKDNPQGPVKRETKQIFDREMITKALADIPKPTVLQQRGSVIQNNTQDERTGIASSSLSSSSPSLPILSETSKRCNILTPQEYLDCVRIIICGPPMFETFVVQHLQSLGYPKKVIYIMSHSL